MIDAGKILGRCDSRLGFREAALRVAVCTLWYGLATSLAPGATNGIVPYSVRTWQTDEGLPGNSVRAIAQTRDGYLWVGTREGLARFDGVRFTVPDDTAPQELREGWITALCASQDGSLWIGCDRYGVVHWKAGEFTRFSEADGLPSNQIRCLLESRDGTLWIGSEGGLTQYKDGRFRSFTTKSGLGANSVRGLYQDRQGNLRIATLRGLGCMDSEGIIHTLNIRLGTSANALKFATEDRQGRIWTGSNEGLNCVDGEKVIFYGVKEGLPDQMVLTAHEDRHGQLWVGTYRGVARMAQGEMVRPPNHEEAYGDLIYTIFEDREGNLWIGGEDGLYRLAPARFTTYTTQQGLPRNNVMSVCEDSSGTLWIGTWGGGLARLKNDKITSSGMTGALKDGQVLALHEARDGALWVGLDHGAGIIRLKDGAQTRFAHKPGLFPMAVRVIREDQQGALWIGTSGGLCIFKAGKFEGFTKENGLSGNQILALCQEGDGRFWMGTDAGLSVFEKGQFRSIKALGAPPATWVNALYLDGEQTLWIGTRGSGLYRYKGGKFISYTTRQGLFSDEVYEILEDDEGYFWMSCRKGIFRVRRKHLDDLDRGAINSIPCIVFGRADGLPSVQCNGVAKPAGWKSRDGRLWFPTIRGVVAVEPGIKPNMRPPPVFIEEVLADGHLLQRSVLAVSDSFRLRVPPGRGQIKIHYTGLSFQAPEKNRFKYRLEGMDRDWVDAGASRVASYDNLPPGQYRFQVIACNNDGVWNETGATLALDLVPHYWQTWWFKGALVAAAAALLGQLYRSRVKRLRDIEQLRVQIAANLHDDVGARLTKVGMLTELVDRDTADSDPGKSHVRNISRTVREIIRAMDEIVWTINPKNDTLDNLANYIFQYAQEYFQDTGIRCRLDVPAQLPDRRVSTEARHNLFMAVKEALNNALKHSGATEVKVGLGASDGHMSITITDNGRGFSVEDARGKGNGLNNMRGRLQQIGGRLSLESEPGRGTSIRLEAAGT